MRNKVEDVRNHLVETIERVMAISDPEASEQDKITIDQAKTISQLADSFTNLVKAELTGMRILAEVINDPVLSEYATHNPLGIEYRNGSK